MKINQPVSDLPSFVAILLVIGGYYIYYAVAYSRLSEKLTARLSGNERSALLLFLFRKITGFVFLGLIPAIVFYSFTGSAFWDFRPDASALNSGIAIFAGLALLITGSSALSSRKKSVYRKIPQIRLEKWNSNTVLAAVTGWAIYLFAYEFLFRGIFLFSWVAEYGLWPAVAVNLAVYSAFHLPNGLDETLGALIFGFFLCLISLYTHTFIFAFFLHLILAVSGELFAVHYNPGMGFNFSKTVMNQIVSADQKNKSK